MRFTYRIFACKVLLVIAGIAWCVAIVRRLRDDIKDVRNPADPESRYVVIGFWAVTVLIAFVLATSGVGVIRQFFTIITDW